MADYNLSDIRAATESGEDGWGGGSWILIILFALIFGWGGNGFGGRGNGANPVTEADLCNANSFNDLKSSTRNISDQIGQMYTGLQNGLCNLGYTTLENFNATQRQLADCCCTTQRAIDGVNYNGAMNTAAINANTTAGIQRVLDKLCEGEKAALQARVQQLELQAALCGVIRYPNATTYAAAKPFMACGCCNNI